MFDDRYKLNQKEFTTNEDCKDWCDEYSDCKAAVVSPGHWAYRECFLVSTATITARPGWASAIKTDCSGEFSAVLEDVGK